MSRAVIVLLALLAPAHAACPPCDCATGAPRAGSAEITDVLRALMIPVSPYRTRHGWIDLVEALPGVAWRTVGIEETGESPGSGAEPYYKAGEIVLTLDGAPTHRVLERGVVPGKWDIVLRGPHGFVESARISMQQNARDADPDRIHDAARGVLPLTEFHCAQSSDDASRYETTYAIESEEWEPAWLHESRSCGSAGCAISLTVLYTREDAEAIAC